MFSPPTFLFGVRPSVEEKTKQSIREKNRDLRRLNVELEMLEKEIEKLTSALKLAHSRGEKMKIRQLEESITVKYKRTATIRTLLGEKQRFVERIESIKTNNERIEQVKLEHQLSKRMQEKMPQDKLAMTQYLIEKERDIKEMTDETLYDILAETDEEKAGRQGEDSYLSDLFDSIKTTSGVEGEMEARMAALAMSLPSTPIGGISSSTIPSASPPQRRF